MCIRDRFGSLLGRMGPLVLISSPFLTVGSFPSVYKKGLSFSHSHYLHLTLYLFLSSATSSSSLLSQTSQRITYPCFHFFLASTWHNLVSSYSTPLQLFLRSFVSSFCPCGECQTLWCTRVNHHFFPKQYSLASTAVSFLDSPLASFTCNFAGFPVSSISLFLPPAWQFLLLQIQNGSSPPWSYH